MENNTEDSTNCSLKLFDLNAPNSTKVTVHKKRTQVENEIPFLVYSYLISEGFEEMAEIFLKDKITREDLIRKHNISGQMVKADLQNYRDFIDQLETTRLTDIITIMKQCIEDNQRIITSNNSTNNNETYNFSLITHAKSRLSKFLNISGSRQNDLVPSITQQRSLTDLLFQQKLTGTVKIKPLYVMAQPYKQLQLTKRILGHVSAIYCFTLDRTKSTLFTGGEDGLIKAWNLNTCVLTATLRGHSKAVNDLSVSHKNDRLASCGTDTTIRIWCLYTCELLYTLKGHNNAVISVCFSPYPVGRYRYLISTSLDGSLCFYKIELGGDIDPNPIKFTEKHNNKHFRINCFTVSPGGTYVVLGVSDPMIRVYKMSIKGPVRTMELYGHSDDVESVVFDNNGTRFCSSSKDGTLCIWTLSITSWKCAQIDVKSDVLSSTDKPAMSKKKNSCSVNVVSWSCDNRRVSCAGPDYIIRNYDSCSKGIVSRMVGHTDLVTVLHHHPHISNILLSSGFDGIIYMWDTETGAILTKLDNNLGEQGYGSVYDLTFVSNGRDFVMCDYNGNWALYSTIPSEHFENIPPSQFFHSDYWGIRENPDTGRIEDVTTDLEPHLMAPPIMVNYFGIPYNNDIQKLIPGTSFVTQRANFEVDNGNSRLDLSVTGPGLVTSGSVEGVRKTGIIHKKNRTNLKCSYLLWFRRLIVNKLSKMDINNDQQIRQQLYKHEQHIHDNIRNRTSGFYDKEERVGRLLRLQSLQKQRKMEKETRRVVALHVTHTRNDRNNLNEDFYTQYSDSIDNDDISISNALPNSGRNSDSEFVGDSEDFRLSESFSIRGKRSARLRSLRPRTSTGAISSRTNGYRNQKNDIESTNVDNGNTVEAPPPPVPDDYPSMWISYDFPKLSPYVPQLNDEVYYFIQGHRLYIQELFQQNVTNLLPNVETFEEYDHNILPHVNPYGYELCQVVDIQYIYKNPLVCFIKLKRLEKEKYVISNNSEATQNFCQKDYFELEFHDMNNVLDFIILREIVDMAMTRVWKPGDRFKSIIDDCWWFGTVEECSAIDIDFPKSPHLSYSILWDTGEYDRLSPWDMENIDSIFENTSEKMDEREHEIVTDSLSATSKLLMNKKPKQALNNYESECYMYSGQNTTEIIMKPIQIESNEMNALYERYIMNSSRIQLLWDEDPIQSCERIANAIDNFKVHYIACAFSVPVDLTTFADYWTLIPHPMDLSKVIARLRNHYYRSKEAILFDLKLIELNALSYNRPGTPIVHCARVLYTLLESLVKNVSQFEVDLKHPLIANKNYPTNINVSNSIRRTKRHRRKKVDYSSNDDESDDNGTTKSTKIGSNEYIVEWINDAFDLLNYLMNLKDCECFLHPVDLEEFPNYTQFVSHPMDFNTVLSNLKCGAYVHPIEMIEHIKLIFSNSRLFNTNPRSKIYSMTIRLSNQFLARSETFLERWSNIRSLKRPLTRSIIKNIYLNYLSKLQPNIDDQSFDDNNNKSSKNLLQNTNKNYNLHNYGLRKSINHSNSRGVPRPSNYAFRSRNSISKSNSPKSRSINQGDDYRSSENFDDYEDYKFRDETSDDIDNDYNVSQSPHKRVYNTRRNLLSKKTKYSNNNSKYSKPDNLNMMRQRTISRNSSDYTSPINSHSSRFTKRPENRDHLLDQSLNEYQSPQPDFYFSNVSPIMCPIRRSERILRRQGNSDRSTSNNELAEESFQHKYSLRNSKRF